MAKKGKQKEQPKPQTQPKAVHPTSSPRSAASQRAVFATPREGTPQLSSPRLTSPRSAQQPFAAEEQAAAAWEAHSLGGWHDGMEPHGKEEDSGWDEENAFADGDGWEGASMNRTRSPVSGTDSPPPGHWPEPQEQDSQGKWGGGFASAFTSVLGFGAHKQEQAPSDPAAAAEGVTRKSTLKKKPPAGREATPATAPPAGKRVAFSSTYSSSLGVRSSSPPLLPSSDPARIPTIVTAPAMPARSQSEGAFARGWGAPEQMPRHFGNVQSSPAAAVGAPWMRWRDEAFANEEARKRGVPAFATTIRANVSTAPPVPMAASHPLRVAPATMMTGNPVMPNIANLQSQLHSILGTGQAHQSAQPHSNTMHRRQASLPAQMNQPSQAWQTWDNRSRLRPQPPEQIQQSNSWENNTWTGQAPSAWEQPADQGGWSASHGAQSRNTKGGGGGDGGGWDQQADEGWGQDGYYDPWESGKDIEENKRLRKHGHTKSTGIVGEWDTAAGWSQFEGGERSIADGKRANNGHEGWGVNDWGAIPEEDEAEEDDYDEDMYTDPEDHEDRQKRKTTHSGISYQYQSPSGRPAWGSSSPFPEAHPGHGTVNGTALLPSADSSKTMNFAAGRMTTVFELTSPRQGLGENTFIWSNGACLQYAQRALYSRRRPAKERIYWAFNPDNDPRVASLMRWIEAMSNGLATIGLQKFLETRQRGALITNADYRTKASADAPTQPAFDWMTLPYLHQTCDRIFQESVVTYKPNLQVVVFVFLLSASGNSMAVWRRKVTIPEAVRLVNQDAITHVMDDLPQDTVVYVDEILPPEPPPPEPPKKKKRGFWKRLFGRK